MSIETSTALQNEKAQTEQEMGFFEFLASDLLTKNVFDNEQLANNQTADILTEFFKPEQLSLVTDNLTIGDSDKATAGELAIRLYDSNFEPSNLAIMPADGKPYLTEQYKHDAFIIGDGNEFIAVNNFDDALRLKAVLGIDSDNYTILATLDDWQFERMAKAHAKQRTLTIFCTYTERQKYSDMFNDYHVRLIVTIEPITDMLLDYRLDEIISDKPNDTKIYQLGAIEWAKPETISTAPATPYPIHAWQGVLRDAVEAIAYHAQVPQAIAGQVILGALSTILQGSINAPYADGVKFMPVALFLLSIYPSGEGKTLANSIAYQQIDFYQDELDRQFTQLKHEWQLAKASAKRSELETFLLENPPPTEKTLYMSSGTLQGILDRMLMNNLKNITWVTADCGQFFGGHSMKADNMLFVISCLSDIWSKGIFDRILSPRAKNAIEQTRTKGVRFTVDLAGQDEVIRPALNDATMNGQGFLPRFLFTAPDVINRVYNTPERMNNYSDSDPRLLKFWDRCRDLLDPLPNPENQQPSDNNAPHERININFADQQARQALADYQQYAQDRKAKGRELEHYPAYANRLAENASRIASLMAFFEGRTLLNADDIQRASMLTEYSIHERMRYTDTPQASMNDSDKLLNWLVSKASNKKPPIVNEGTIGQYAPNALRRQKDSLLDDLESMGLVMRKKQGKQKLVYINEYLFK